MAPSCRPWTQARYGRYGFCCRRACTGRRRGRRDLRLLRTCYLARLGFPGYTRGFPSPIAPSRPSQSPQNAYNAKRAPPLSEDALISHDQPLPRQEEFDRSASGGGAENRTPVHTKSSPRLYKLIQCSGFGRPRPIDRSDKRPSGFDLSLAHTSYIARSIPLKMITATSAEKEPAPSRCD